MKKSCLYIKMCLLALQLFIGIIDVSAAQFNLFNQNHQNQSIVNDSVISVRGIYIYYYYQI